MKSSRALASLNELIDSAPNEAEIKTYKKEALKYTDIKKSSYNDLLKHPKWQKKRLECLSRDEFQCSKCGDDENTLNVHHRYYIKERKPWEYPLWSLTTLCDGCHNSTHDPDDYVREESFETILEFLGAGLDHHDDAIWSISLEICRIIKIKGSKETYNWLINELHETRTELEKNNNTTNQ